MKVTHYNNTRRPKARPLRLLLVVLLWRSVQGLRDCNWRHLQDATDVPGRLALHYSPA